VPSTTTSRSRLVRSALGVLGVTALATTTLSACGVVGSSEDQLDTVVVGSANFTESELLGEIYAQALEADGVDAEQQPGIGAREAYMKAIEGDNPSINVLPEYLGYLLEYYNDDIPDPTVQGVTQQLKKDLPPELETLQMSPATDEDAVVVTPETARRYDLETIADLAPVADQMTAGGSPEFRTRRAGLAGMREVYGVEFKDYKTLDTGGPLSLKQLLADDIQVTDFFTTQSVIEENNLVILKDPKNIVLPGNVVPVIRTDIPDKEQVTQTLDSVSQALTTAKLTEMVKAIDVDKEPKEDVAEQFLSEAGLN
jgi:osmoprotectant transport system substrate-binding protein